MRRTLSALLFAAVLVPSPALAQTTIDLKSLPAEIKTLPWKDVDLSKLSDLQRCQALLVVNQVLDEMGAQLVAEADLMSAFIDDNQMGPAFASQPPVDDAPTLTLENAQQMAAALLKGPMANSPYASELAGSDADVLTAYEHMYTSTCQSKWSAMINNQLRVRAMSRFIQAQGKMDAYMAWVPGEVKRQTEQHDAAVAARQQADAAEEARRNQKLNAALQQQKQQREQQAAQQQAARSMQQAMSHAQQQNQPEDSGDNLGLGYGYPNYYYGGWGAVGGGGWYRDGAYQGNAAARTDARMNNWHGAGNVGLRR